MGEVKNLHFKSTPVSRCNGEKKKSAVAMAAYRSGDILQDERYQETWNYTRKDAIYHSEIITPDNAPAWAHNRQQLWNKVEASEKRFDARVTREFTIALPQELSHQQKVELIRGFAQEEFANKGIIADVACHNFTGRQAHNPHAHIMITTRHLEGEKFGKKIRELDNKNLLIHWRDAYEKHANLALERAGLEVRASTKKLEERGITDRAPISESMAVHQMREKHNKNPRKYAMPEVGKENDELRQLNQELADLQRELAEAEEREKEERENQEERADKQDPNTLRERAEKLSIFTAEQTAQTSRAANQHKPPSPTEELDEDTRELLKQWQEYRERERRKSRRPEDRDERDFEPDR
jgi:ATP-dependent exoDNAse (exonuclease V) alpha subunit